MSRFLFLLFLVISIQASAVEENVTSDLGDVLKKVKELSQKYKASEILVVYDIDNTLMAMKTDLGSDQWYDWQETIVGDANNKDRVATSPQGLLKALGLLYTLGSMRLTQENIPQIVSEVTGLKVEQIILTSRGPDSRAPTERELMRNKIPLWDDSRPSAIGHDFPYDPNNLQKNCFTENDRQRFKMDKPRVISAGRNMILSNGQHKGMVLKSYLCTNSNKYKAIVFADDRQKNIDAMVSAYAEDKSVELATYRYSGEDKRVEAFIAGDKLQARRDWTDLYLPLNVIFDTTF